MVNHVSEPPHRLLVVGDGEVASALESIARTLEWDVTVTTDLATVTAATPSSGSVVVLSHHDGTDGPALATALAAGTAYVGAMGSRRTQARRSEWLLENGVPKDRVESVRGPAGLNIGADTPAEIAVAIVAEVVAVSRGVTTGGSLRDRPGPIHPDLPPGTAECPAG